ncbi:MAG TPA: DNA-processing protein DprA [Bacteroidales bacterium]|nr:DNA-processing protein DprA [Bacteroidales bacterium]
MTKDDSLRYQIGISLIPKIGPVLSRRLIEYCGSAEGVFREKQSGLLKVPGFGEKLSGQLRNKEVLEQADSEIEYMMKNNITPVFYLDKNYPRRLKQCEDAPVIFFLKGSTNLDRQKILSIVGTRNASEYGKELCNKLIEGLAGQHSDLLIISGLAYGIDVCAHKSALKQELDTVAVLGHGLSTVYPAIHRSIANQISTQGALLTEFISGEIPDAPNFIRRNRIIAGLADATVVVESGEKGGALITADIANSYNRDVFAFPGRISDKYSAGCNKLIKANRAALIEDFKDLEYLMGWQMKQSPATAQKKMFVELNDDERLIMNLLEETDGLTIDQIAAHCHLPVSKISWLLINLEFNGLVKCLPGKFYKKTV